MKKQKIHPAITHLTPKEVEELYERYLDSTEKIANLIEEYKIDIRPNLLSKVFPPYKLKNQLCPYCDIAMYKKRKTRSSGYYEDRAFCYQCEHKLFSTQDATYYSCNCTNCITAHRRKEEEQLHKTKTLIRKKHASDDISPIPYQDLTFRQKFTLMTLFYTCTDEGLHCIFSLTNFYTFYPRKRLSPTPEMDIKYINELYDKQIVIPDPESPIEAFNESTNYTEVYRDKANMLVNVTLDGLKRAEFLDLFKKVVHELSSHVHPEWADDIYSLLYELAIEEVMQYIAMKSEELKLPFKPQDKARYSIRELLDDFSVSEIYYFVYKVVGDARLFYDRGEAKNKIHAANTITPNLASFGKKAKENAWPEKRYSRDSRVPRSEMSKVFFDTIFKDKDAGFHKAPGKQWTQELLPIYFSDSMSRSYGVVRCPSCQCISIEFTMVAMRQLILKCLDCSKRATYLLDKVHKRE